MILNELAVHIQTITAKIPSRILIIIYLFFVLLLLPNSSIYYLIFNIKEIINILNLLINSYA